MHHDFFSTSRPPSISYHGGYLFSPPKSSAKTSLADPKECCLDELWIGGEFGRLPGPGSNGSCCCDGSAEEDEEGKEEAGEL